MSKKLALLNMVDPGSYYRDRLQCLELEKSDLMRTRRWLAWARLASFVVATIATILLWTKPWVLALAGAVLLYGLFFFLVKKDWRNSEKIRKTKLLIKIQLEELDHLQFQFQERPDGSKWQPANHPFSYDLDLFGRSSLFQFVNRASSEQGEQQLANSFLYPGDQKDIPAMQEAVKELGSKPGWRQDLEAAGIENPVSLYMQERIRQWISEPARFVNNNTWKLLRWLLPTIAWALLLMYLINVVPLSALLSSLIILLAISFYISRLVFPAYSRLNKIAPQLESLAASLKLIENENFNAPALLHHQVNIKRHDQSASVMITRLKKILDRLDYRLNPVVFIPLSVFLCWDLQQVFALEKWKTKQHHVVTSWFDTLGAFEKISSLANLHFNHPGWCFPRVTDQTMHFEGEELGHPLISDTKRVSSSFKTTGSPAISLITGSNMAGKSTFLRAFGLNTVLAMSGGPVCAKTLLIAPVDIISSMRVSDNLEESTSTFYAELKKLKEVIGSVKDGKPVFFLLDEILRGTNSNDRHTGSKALIRQLVTLGGTGLIATHDLELARLENEFPSVVRNYHFDVQVSGEELYFDYKLKDGVCQSMNASILMKKIGIDL